MKPVRLSAEAEADLEAIADFIAIDNPVRAESFARDLRRQCDLLGEHPFKGRPALLPEAGVRRLAYKGYVILYQVLDAFVAVDRVLHGARDIDGLFAGEGGD